MHVSFSKRHNSSKNNDKRNLLSGLCCS